MQIVSILVSKYGGDSTMRTTRWTNVGNYFYNDIHDPQLELNDKQEMKFTGNHKGPFYLKKEERQLFKFPRLSGVKKKIKLSIQVILEILRKDHNFVPKRRYLKDELHKVDKDLGVTLETETDDHVIPGWYNSQKGLL